MGNKEKYLKALKSNCGNLDELSLGETIGFDENTTLRIISQLLSEYRIVFETDGQCNYIAKRKR